MPQFQKMQKQHVLLLQHRRYCRKGRGGWVTGWSGVNRAGCLGGGSFAAGPQGWKAQAGTGLVEVVTHSHTEGRGGGGKAE